MPDGHWRNRLGLALAMLEGDKDAHKILADLLEEAGERGLAQWARSRKGKIRRPLEFVLALLPYRAAVLLACDYAECVGLTLCRRLGQTTIDEVRRQVGGHSRNIGLQIEPELLAASFRLKDDYEPIQHLKRAGQWVEIAESYQRNHQPQQEASAAREAVLEARRVARWACDYPLESMIWLLEHTRRALQELIRQGGCNESRLPEEPSSGEPPRPEVGLAESWVFVQIDSL